MKTWMKVLAGCGGLGCLATIGLVVLVLALPDHFASDVERIGRERREREEREQEARWQADLEERLERAAKAGEEARTRLVDLFVRDEHARGGFVTLTQHVFDVHYGHQDSSLGTDNLFPAHWPVEWEAVQVIDASDSRHYAIYRHRSDGLDTRFAVRLTDPRLPLLGHSPESGCYRYLGLMEGKGRHGIVPFMVFERTSHKDPLCTGHPD
jgi:hypothetical protein